MGAPEFGCWVLGAAVQPRDNLINLAVATIMSSLRCKGTGGFKGEEGLMGRFVNQLICMLAVLGVFATPVRAEKRVALVIGNSAYNHAPRLRNPVNDAEAVAALLKRLNFDVLKGIDLTDKGFAKTIGDFSEKLDAGADVAVFFYAGHGLQVNGKNYLAPVDAKLQREASLEFEAVRLNTILSLMERRDGTTLVFLDACRDNPLAHNLARNMGTRSTTIGRGLAPIKTGVGTLIAFATQPGNVAMDGKGVHSPFAWALLKHAETPGLEIEGMMRRVRRDVIAATSGAQVPWNHSSLTAPFRFKEKPDAGGESSTATKQPYNVKATELSFWESIRGSTNAALYMEYLRRYPGGDFAVIAGSKLYQLKKVQKAPDKRKDLMATIVSDNQFTAVLYQTRREMTIALQKELTRVGCDPGAIDGKWGSKGRGALAKFNRYARLVVPTDTPTPGAINAIRARNSRVCPVEKTVKLPQVVCGPRFRAVGGRCVKRSCGPGKKLASTGRCVGIANDRNNKGKPNSRRNTRAKLVTECVRRATRGCRNNFKRKGNPEKGICMNSSSQYIWRLECKKNTNFRQKFF